MSKLFLLAFVFIAVSVLNRSLSQNIDRQNLSNVIPPSPEVASLAKHIDMSVGYSSGTPNISIPLFNIKTGPLQLPITLSYSGSSGIKVEEAASWVGLGWNLEAGGSVSRIVRGLPDDISTNGVMYTTKTPKYILSLPNQSSERYNLLYNDVYAGNSLDVEPDIYMFSVMGYSGKFYFDQQQGKFVLTPLQKIKIEFGGLGSSYTGFLLTLPNGIKCYFGANAVENSSFQQIINNDNGSFSLGGGSGVGSHITSWQLEKILAPTGEAIIFSYTYHWVDDFGRGGETTDYGACQDGDGIQRGNGRFSASYFLSSTQKPVLDKIEWDQGRILFNLSSQYRQDMMGYARSLESVVMQDAQQKQIKAFSFQHNYFTSTDNALSYIDNTGNAAKKRLYLKSLTESGVGVSLPPYKFYYDTTNILPSRWSTSQDYWGYYNGRSNGNTITPKVETSMLYYGYSLGGSLGTFFTGADRRVDTNYTSACVLKKIIYPTGGTSEYFYEPNKVSSQYASYLNGYSLSGLTSKSKFTSKSTILQNPNNSSEYIDSFEVNEIVGYVKIYAPFDCANFNSFECKIHSTITGITDPNYTSNITSSEMYLLLPKGKYKVTTTLTESLDDPPLDFNIAFNWEENLDTLNLLVGGLRLKKIINDDGTGSRLTKTLSYNSFSDTAISSGQLINLPVHAFKVFCGYGNEISPTVLRIVSASELSISSSDGQMIRYGNVTEYSDEQKTSFKTEYTLSSDHYGFIFPNETNYPYPTNVQRSWRSNLLLQKKQYEKISNGYRIVMDENYVYKNFGTVYKDTFGIRVSPYPVSTGFGYTPYKFVTEWYLIDTVFSETYAYGNEQSEMLSMGTKYFYNDSFSVANTRVVNSKGQVIDNKTWYPYNYNNVSGYNISSLINAYILEVPIKQETSVNGKLRNGSITRYNSLGQPIEMFAYQGSTLLDTVLHDPNTIVPSGYVSNANLHYSIGNNLKTVISNSSKKAYIWDYNNTLPVAECINADSSDIAYTSFESDGTGNWSGVNSSSISTTGGLTGTKYLNQNSISISKSGLISSKTYIVTYWSRDNQPYAIQGTLTNYPVKLRTVAINGVTWVLHQHLVSGQTTITITGSGALDELRLYPEVAQMTTYTYAPLVGMTSQSSSNDQMSFYEYDALGRLSLIRDQNYNVLKKICYNYFGQQEDCGNPTPLWQPTGQTRCKPCPSNGNYTTNVQERQEKDNNPGSPTYNTYRWVEDGVNGTCVIAADWQNTSTSIRCKVISSNNSGEQEQEQKDMNPCSPTFNTLRWVVIGANCTTCPKPQIWQSTGNYRCVLDGNGNYTGGQEREEINNESCSPNYNTTRWVSNGINCSTCPKPQTWQTTGNYRCVLDGNGNSTGAQEREEINTESCSQNYNSTRWVSNGTNCSSCAKPQNWQSTGNYRCVQSSGNNTGYQEREERNMESCSPDYYSSRWVSNGLNTTSCPLPVQTIYAQLTYENPYSTWSTEYADIVVRFYSDAACTQPLSVSNLQVNYSAAGFNSGGSFQNFYNASATGTYVVLAYNVILTDYSSNTLIYQDYFLETGNYTIAW